MTIHFGTDGWRAIIGEEYTFDNVRACAQGVASYLKETGLDHRGLVVGYDTRFASEDFAAAVAEVTSANGIKTYLSQRWAPTPVISYSIVDRGAGGAAIITASHNPHQWNGFKYKPEYAGSASPEVVAALERHIAEALSAGGVKRNPLKEALDSGTVEYIDPMPPYLENVVKLLDLERLRHAGLNLVVDSMFGAGAGYFNALLGGGATQLHEINGERNPLFPSIAQPEPVAHNLTRLSEETVHRQAAVGIAVDGDADRLGVVDEKGDFITTLQTFALLCIYLLETRGQRGPLVRSITMTSMIDRLGELYGVPVFKTPVGFKYLGPVMMREDALATGEESGGYAFRGNIPERDGILSGLMFLDLMVQTGKSPSDLLSDLYTRVGPHYYHRWDLPFDSSERQAIEERVAAARPTRVAGLKVEGIDTGDGYQFLLEGGYWALVRFSGTEPLLRLYAEGRSREEVERILEEARKLVGI